MRSTLQQKQKSHGCSAKLYGYLKFLARSLLVGVNFPESETECRLHEGIVAWIRGHVISCICGWRTGGCKGNITNVMDSSSN